ncbi:MAG: hypothetical protein H7Z38_21710 [Rubrivivax sp.]|nr:hypothetical protein [Pyrinomonadaceae bacterium]
MKKLALAVAIALSLLTPSLPAGAQEELAACPSTVRTIDDCPAEGCGRGGDGPLNTMKNRTTAPSDPEELTLASIRALRQPTRWTLGQERSSISANESRAVVVTAILRDARASGSETTNCKLTGRRNNDFHLDLASRRNDPKARAVTAEVTPRVRPDGWTFGKLDALGNRKAFVRVTGWLMLDTQHIRSPLVRSTNWEIHPVTKFEVCTLTVTRCRAGEGWVNLEDFEL